MHSSFLGAPRVAPYLPVLPSTSTARGAHTSCGAQKFNIGRFQFAEIATERVCLECASPFNRCGHCYFSLRRDTVTIQPKSATEQPLPEENDNEWTISTFPCTCGTCAEIVESLALTGGSNNVVVDRRLRMATRHDTEMLDIMLGVDESLNTQACFVSNRVPVLLLRRMLLGKSPTMPMMPLLGYCRETILPRVFCSFSRTVAFMSTREGMILFKQRVLQRRTELEKTHMIDVSDEVASSPRACRVVAAALLRITIACDLKKEVRCNSRYNYTTDVHVQYYEYMMQLFIDTHLDLLLAADVRGAHNDVALTEPMSATVTMPAADLASNSPLHDIIRRSIYDRCYPHPLRALHAGELPDLTNSTFDSDLWTKTSDNTRSRVTELIHNFESKTQNHRCAGRNIAKMVCEMWGYNVPSATLVMNLLEIHTLGNYPGVVYRPGVRARLATRRAYSLDELKSEPWCAWCHYADTNPCPQPGCENRNTNKRQRQHNDHICSMCQQFQKIEPKLTAAIREFFVFTVRCHYITDMIMRVDNEWTAYSNVVGLAADESRIYTERMYASRTPLSAQELTQIQEKQIYAIELVQQCNKSVQRLRKDYMFAELMLRMCNHAHTGMICQTWSGPQRPEDYLMAPVNRNFERFTDERLKRMNACFEPLPHLGNKMWCEVFSLEYLDAVARAMLQHAGDIVISLLPLIGVSPQCFKAVQDLHRNSELRNMPDNSFKSACTKLCQLFPVDFHIIHCLLLRINSHDQFRVIVLDEKTAIAQVKALRARHGIMPWNPLPPLDRLYFCPAEGRVYADLVEPLTDELIQKAVDDCDGDALTVTNSPFGTGPKGALYSHVTHKLHCTRPPSSSIGKKYERDGYMAQEEFFGETDDAATAEDKRTAKSIRVAQNSQRACSQPLKFVSMIGKLARIGSHLYALCTMCAAPFIVQNNSMTSDGFVCGRHVRFLDQDRYTELREYVSRHTRELHTKARTNDDKNDTFMLVERFSSIDRGVERTHIRLSRQLTPLCAPSNVRPKSSPVEKMYCIGTPCYTESKFRSNVDLLSWAAQLGSQIMSTRVIARRFGVEEPAPEQSIIRQLELEEEAMKKIVETKEILLQQLKSCAEEDRNAVLKRQEKLREVETRVTAKIERLKEKIEEATRIAEAAAAAAEAAEAAEEKNGLTLEQAEKMTHEAVDSGACLQRVAITCAFCRARCEKNGCFTRLNIIDVDGLFVEPLWQRPIETRGRIDIWLCKRDFDKVVSFVRNRPQVFASDLWDALTEMKRRTFIHRLKFQQKKK